MMQQTWHNSSPFTTTGPDTDSAGPDDRKLVYLSSQFFLCIILTLISGICLCVHVKEKTYQIWYTLYSMAGSQHAQTLKSLMTKVKGQGHTVMKWAASIGMHVNMND